jgi:glutathione S-transferase
VRAVARVSEPVLYGADYSVYTRIARLALLEKGVSYRFETVDVFAASGPPETYLRRHPFGRIPAFEHGGVALYEACAICRYVDEAFPGLPLQPADAAGRARITQIVSLLDAYAFRPMVMDIYVERVSAPKRGRTPDEARIATAVPKAERCLSALARLIGDAPWLAGPALTLADLHAAPMFSYFTQADEGAALLKGNRSLREWWQRMVTRESLLATRFAGEVS